MLSELLIGRYPKDDGCSRTERAGWLVQTVAFVSSGLATHPMPAEVKAIVVAAGKAGQTELEP
jgi:hypothetical protein